MNRAKVQHFLWRHTYIFSLLLLVVLLAVNYSLQDNLFELRVLNNSMRTLLPLILLAVGQAIVVIGGGIDLSVGTMVSMLVAMLVNLIDPEDRKSTRLNSSHVKISYAVFCLKKKKNNNTPRD